MHPSAELLGSMFIDSYGREFDKILEVGSQNVNGSLRNYKKLNTDWIGIDIAPGDGVDVVLDDPFKFPFEDHQFDLILASSIFEHSDFFWLTFLELVRILKPTGFLYINVPSNGYFHRFPTDSWRFYPDAAISLLKWAKKSGYQVKLIESFTHEQIDDVWNDFVAIYSGEKPRAHEVIHDKAGRVNNVYIGESFEIGSFESTPQDLATLGLLKKKINFFIPRIKLWNR